nr:tRNA lysidine(34) synthetase TilS [Bacteroidales bacterium]
DCMLENMQRFAQAERLMKTSTEKMLLDCVEKDSNQVLIRLDKLPEGAIENGSLFSLLRNFDVQASYAEEVLKLTQSQPGKYVNCGKIQVLRDRDSLIIKAKKSEVASEYFVSNDTRLLTEPLVLHFEISRNRNPEFSRDPSIAYLDYDCLQFPLVIRRWRKGDRFMPLGMNGFKKLSDFFTDNKLSRFDKENQYLICSGEDIVWVIGYRIDERYKVKKTTKQIFTIQL